MLSLYLVYPPKESSITTSTRGPIGLNALFYVMLSPKGEIFKELTEGSHWLSALFTLSYTPKESCLKNSLRSPICLRTLFYYFNELPTDQKSFSDLAENFVIISL